MRIVAVADTHMYQSDLRTIPDGDVFIHAGDLCRHGSLDELEAVVPWLTELPHAHKLVVAGNHDRCFESNIVAARGILGGSIVYLQDSAIEIGGVKFWGSPWQPRYQNWAFNLDRGDALAAIWRLIPEETQVLVTHGPPQGFGDRTSWPGRRGCADLLEAVRRVRPALHLFGHIHSDAGVWELDGIVLANVTTDECLRSATVIDFDPVTGKVSVISTSTAL